jgi:hypothetical protein
MSEAGADSVIEIPRLQDGLRRAVTYAMEPRQVR